MVRRPLILSSFRNANLTRRRNYKSRLLGEMWLYYKPFCFPIGLRRFDIYLPLPQSLSGLQIIPTLDIFESAILPRVL